MPAWSVTLLALVNSVNLCPTPVGIRQDGQDVGLYKTVLAVVMLFIARYGKVISTKAIMDPAVNKCKGMFSHLSYNICLFIKYTANCKRGKKIKYNDSCSILSAV